MHRAVLLAVGPEIDVEAIRMPDGQPLMGAAAPAGCPQRWVLASNDPRALASFVA